MDISVDYLGLKLRSPLVPSASPLSEEIDNLKLMEDSGASAVVLRSLFEEQLRLESYEIAHYMVNATESNPEGLTYFPQPGQFLFGPDEYLNHIRKAKQSIKIPVIASLNGTSLGAWTAFSKSVEQAGADAIELNIYSVPTQISKSGADVENEVVEILRAVKSNVKIPVTVKLSPFYSNMTNMASRLDQAGANALVLFNRFYQPDFDLETLEIKTNVLLSTPQSLRLPLTWIGILYGKVKADLAGTGGVHEALDALKLIMAGADITMLCSVLLKNGITYIKNIEADMVCWMEAHEYVSIRQMHGSLSQIKCADPGAFERANYMRAIMTLPPSAGGAK